MDRWAYSIVAIGILLVGLLSLAGLLTAARVRGDRTCLAAGYPTTAGSWLTGWYCVKRLNQTDGGVPIEAVR